MKRSDHKPGTKNTGTYSREAYRLSLGADHFKNGFKKVSFQKGASLFREGSAPQGLYFLEEGKIKLSRLKSDGQEQIIRIAQPGDMIGFSVLLKDARYRYSATIIADAILSFIPREDFLEQLDHELPGDSFLTRLMHKVAQQEVFVAAPSARNSLAGLLFSWPPLAAILHFAGVSLMCLWSGLHTEGPRSQ